MYGTVGELIHYLKLINWWVWSLFNLLGAGKTMLMDMFYKTTKVKKKQRLHFNEFMMDAHKRQLPWQLYPVLYLIG